MVYLPPLGISVFITSAAIWGAPIGCTQCLLLSEICLCISEEPQQYQNHPEAGRLQGKPLGNVITLYKPWCKEAEKICSMIQTNVKLLIFNYCRDKWHNSIRNRQEAISISVSVPGMWPADAKCPSRIGLSAAHGKIQGSVEEIS